ncbi:hypothetical protein SAMN02745108_02753 [Fibrobacter intestinalis]|uniref:Uncharacterized protein n=1 Tax=Fibrobacter intestinalis TaxID=28122 RepID=A0A1T4RKE0_9BACT|nr:hypothetical protein BGW94_2141 [Fibrobacter sp. NR9]SKA16218.1 hypothetical protein SAMN02745108_02753 [Fibrobacter intestinalis]
MRNIFFDIMYEAGYFFLEIAKNFYKFVAFWSFAMKKKLFL